MIKNVILLIIAVFMIAVAISGLLTFDERIGQNCRKEIHIRSMLWIETSPFEKLVCD